MLCVGGEKSFERLHDWGEARDEREQPPRARVLPQRQLPRHSHSVTISGQHGLATVTTDSGV